MFKTLNIFNEALDKRYGAPANVDEYAMKAQVLAYEGERAMFEAFGRNKYVATGVIQWMLNNAWPSLIWHLYDYYLRPGGSYFGAKKACEPLHIQYSYDDKSVVVVNSFRSEFKALVAKAEVYNFDLTPKFSKEAALDSPADSSTPVFSIPVISGLSTTYYVRLTLTRNSTVVSRNFYWLSTQPDVMDLEKSNYYVTPTKTFADMKALNTLPKVHVAATMTPQKNGAQVTVENTGAALAFAVRLKILSGDEEVLPVLWEDNYLALMPGEKRILTAKFQTKQPITLAVSGWNVAF
jgi:exo-1,4-beta-D-glucosaminidase